MGTDVERDAPEGVESVTWRPAMPWSATTGPARSAGRCLTIRSGWIAHVLGHLPDRPPVRPRARNTGSPR